MKEIKIIDIPIEDIEDNPFYPRRFEEFDKEDIKQMSKSFEKSGLLNAIIVREIKKGPENKTKYQLIAGKRRIKAFDQTDQKTIPARIVEADDIEMQIMSLAENYHRKDLSISDKESYIYRLWNNGNQKGIFHNNLHIMEEWTGISHQVLSDIVNAGKEKEQDNSEAVQLATAKDLQRTRGIKDIPDLRKLLLEGSVIKKKIKILDVENLVKIIKKIDGLENDILHRIVKLVIDEKLRTENVKDIISLIIILDKKDQIRIIEKLERYEKSIDKENFSIFELKSFIDTYIRSFEDIKEKLLNNNINLNEAIELNKFKYRDQRENVLVELRQYNKKIKSVENEKFRYLKKRSQQAKDLEEEELELKEYLDTEKFTTLEEEELKVIDKIVKIKKELLQFDFIKINKLNVGNKNFAVDFLWEIYNNFHRLLVDLGEIKSDIKVELDEDVDDIEEELEEDTSYENVEEDKLEEDAG